MIIQIPESVRDYINDRSVQSVVDHMIEQKESDLPVDLEWHEIRDYYQAWLASRKVQVDYAVFALNLWDAIWRPVLQGHELIEYTVKEMADESDSPALAKVWKEEALGIWCSFRQQAESVFFYSIVYPLHDGNLQIAFYAESDADDLSSALELGENWKPEPNEHENRETRKGMLRIKPDSQDINVTPLIAAAEEIISSALLHIKQ